MSRLRCTVSGGLEEFARRELEEVFGRNLYPIPPENDVSDSSSATAVSLSPVSIEVDKGNSGSKIYVNGVRCLEEDPILFCQKLRKLRFVEYVSLHLGSATAIPSEGGLSSDEETNSDQSKSDLLEAIQRATKDILSSLDHPTDDYFLLWKTIQDKLKDFPVGLEPLPGRILPTPSITPVESEGELSFLSTQYRQSSFFVNSIYTRPCVARMVVQTLHHVVAEMMIGQASNNTLWLDAGCGAHGCLLRCLPPGRRIGVDIQLPKNENGVPLVPDDLVGEMHQADFLHDVSKEWLKSRVPLTSNQNIVVISNPPFASDSRGNYKPIAQFIRRSFDALAADVVGVIVPTKFARQCVMESLGLQIVGDWGHISGNKASSCNDTTRTACCLHVVARMNLPNHSFYDPSTLDTKNIPSTFLVLARVGHDQMKENAGMPNLKEDDPTFRLRVEGHRNKSVFPSLRTEELQRSVLMEMKRFWNPGTISFHGGSDPLVMTITANLTKKDDRDRQSAAIVLDSYLVLNPKRPLSLVNSPCRDDRIEPPHSLGWLSTSCKPPVALAMLQSVVEWYDKSHEGPFVVVNGMCGEGTIELEGQRLFQTDDRSASSRSHFWLSGDKDMEALVEAKSRTSTLACNRGALIDFVQWDCQHLPLRSGIFEAFVVDLPIAGTRSKSEGSKKHQTPSLLLLQDDASTLDYRKIIRQSLSVLAPGFGQAAFVSPDTNSLKFAMREHYSYWRSLIQQDVLLGGIRAEFMCLQRKPSTTKDITLRLSSECEKSEISSDSSEKLLRLACDACSQYRIDKRSWQLQEQSRDEEENGYIKKNNFVVSVDLKDVYVGVEKKTHCYRITFDPIVSKQQSKILEKAIRRAVVESSQFDTFYLN